MTSPKKDNIVIAEHGIITQEALLAYLNDELSVEQKQELDSLLKQDPFAQDALEGLRSTQDKAAINTSLVSIRRKVNERIGGKKERRTIALHWSNYAYAAVILGFLISVGFIITAYFNGKHDDIAMNAKSEQTITEQDKKVDEVKPATPVGTTTASSDTISVTTNANGTASPVTTPLPMGNANNLQQQPAKVATETKKDDKSGYQEFFARSKTKDTTSMALNEVSFVSAKKKETAKETKEKTVTKTTTTADYTITNNDVSTNNNNAGARGQMTSTGGTTNNNVNYFAADKIATKPEATKKAADVATTDDEDATMTGAKKTFFNGDYKKSAVEFDEILKKHPDNAQALFFGGVSQYVNGDLDKSEKNFDKILSKGHKFTDGAKWYKASILLKKGNKDAAKNLLLELSHTKGSYKERAEKKLAELQ